MIQSKNYIYIYNFFIRHTLTPTTAGLACNSATQKRQEGKSKGGRREKKITDGAEGKTFHNGCVNGEEEQNGKQKEKQKKESGSGSPTQLPWTIWLPLTTCMDHMVGIF